MGRPDVLKRCFTAFSIPEGDSPDNSLRASGQEKLGGGFLAGVDVEDTDDGRLRQQPTGLASGGGA